MINVISTPAPADTTTATIPDWHLRSLIAATKEDAPAILAGIVCEHAYRAFEGAMFAAGHVIMDTEGRDILRAAYEVLSGVQIKTIPDVMVAALLFCQRLDDNDYLTGDNQARETALVLAGNAINEAAPVVLLALQRGCL